MYSWGRVEETVQLDGFVEVSEVLRSGVYVLLAKGKVVYVGKSKAMLARLYTHRQNYISRRRGKTPEWLTAVKGIFFDEIHIRHCPVDQLDALEREMIDRYRPIINKLLVPEDVIQAEIGINIAGVVLTLNRKLGSVERRL